MNDRSKKFKDIDAIFADKFSEFETNPPDNVWEHFYTIERLNDVKNFHKFIKKRNKKLLFLNGSPGSGKTTVLRFLVEKYTQKNYFDNIIYIPGINISSLSDFESIVLKEIDSHKWSNVISETESHFKHEFFEIVKRNNLLIIIDGFNENISPENQQNLLNQLLLVTNNFNKNSKLIISSSDSSIVRMLPNIPTSSFLELSPAILSQKNYIEIISTHLKYLKLNVGISNEEYIKLASINLKEYSTETLDIFLRLLKFDYKKVISLITNQDFELNNILKELVSNVWPKLSDNSRHLIRTLLLFEDIATVEKLSLLVDINDEEFLDSINELSNSCIINVTGKIISLFHVALKETFNKFLGGIHVDSGNTLDIYFDLNFVSKDQIFELLKVLNETYQTIGGDELIIRENEIGKFC